MPRPDSDRCTLFVFALCAVVTAIAASHGERATPIVAPAVTPSGVAFAARLGDAAISLSWR